MTEWITTPLTDPVPIDGLAPAPPGAIRRYLGAIDVELGHVGAVAVIDVDAWGAAWIRAVTGDVTLLGGLDDTLRAGGARLLVEGDPPHVREL